MALTIAAITAENVSTLRTRSANLAENLDDKRLYASLVALFWAVLGDDGGALESDNLTNLKANAQLLCQGMSEKELKAALAYSLWSSVS
jgi:hypothetical protein